MVVSIHPYILIDIIRLRIANLILITLNTHFHNYNYNKANVESIKKSIESVNWKLMFSNKCIHKQVSIFNKTIYFQTLLHINL